MQIFKSTYAHWQAAQTASNLPCSHVYVGRDATLESHDAVVVVCGNHDFFLRSVVLESDESAWWDACSSSVACVSESDAYVALLGSLTAPRTTTGQPIITPSGYAFVAEHTAFKGYLYTATAGAHSFFDEVLTDQIYLQGGSWWVRGAALGDYIEFSVVDKDDVLGAFSAYGLTVGQDVLEVGKFVRTLYLPPGDSVGEKRVEAPAHVYAGLYLRLTYHSVGVSDIQLSPDYLWHEV